VLSHFDRLLLGKSSSFAADYPTESLAHPISREVAFDAVTAIDNDSDDCFPTMGFQRDTYIIETHTYKVQPTGGYTPPLDE
jgi:hypothetical protein